MLKIYGWGKEEKLFSGIGFPFRVMKMFQNQIEVVVTQQCECTKCH